MKVLVLLHRSTACRAEEFLLTEYIENTLPQDAMDEAFNCFDLRWATDYSITFSWLRITEVGKWYGTVASTSLVPVLHIMRAKISIAPYPATSLACLSLPFEKSIKAKSCNDLLKIVVVLHCLWQATVNRCNWFSRRATPLSRPKSLGPALTKGSILDRITVQRQHRTLICITVMNLTSFSSDVGRGPCQPTELTLRSILAMNTVLFFLARMAQRKQHLRWPLRWNCNPGLRVPTSALTDVLRQWAPSRVLVGRLPKHCGTNLDGEHQRCLDHHYRDRIPMWRLMRWILQWRR